MKEKKEEYKDHLFALILAGGGGTRLWPKSKEKTPKQFLKLFEGKTLTQITYERFRKTLEPEKIFLVTVSEAYKKEILKEIPEFKPENILVEPARRETGPAHGLGASYILKRDKDAVIITEAADRLVKPVLRYLAALEAAAKLAYEKGVLVALGVDPRYPHTGLGHIKKGEKLENINDINFFKLEEFVEKPPLDVAKRYTESKQYFWNAGEFVWRADVLLGELKVHAPEIYKKLEVISATFGTKEEEKTLKEVYETMPKVAIDYAVAEKSKKFVVVHGNFFWTDIGDWQEVWENKEKDDSGNVIIDGEEEGGEVIAFEVKGSLIHSDGRLIAAVGLDDIIIVDTKDALLVVKKDKAQKVKKIVNLLKEKKKVGLL